MLPGTFRKPSSSDAPQKSNRCKRSAIATVELAICIPVLTLIVFGSIQATNLIFLQHAATAAAYEGSLEMAKSNASNASVRARIEQVLEARGVGKTQIAILPAGTEISRTPPGTLLTIQVTADVRSNTSVFGFFSMQNQVTGSLVATR